ncbi:MAG: hypothetical protein ACQEQM_08575 [Thermoplasmatota archaeon]
MKAEKRIPVTEKRWKKLHSMKKPGQTYDELLEELIQEHNRLELIRKAKDIKDMEEEELVEVDLDEWEETGRI